MNYVVHRASESDHSARVSLLVTTDAVPCARAGHARSAPGVATLLLQLRSAAWGAEVRTRDADAGDAGGLATRRLTLRDIFVSLRRVVWWLSVVRVFANPRRRAAAAVTYMPVAA